MTESERDELEMLLAALPADVLPLDAMHGFMTALVMADDSTPMATWAQGLLHTADTPLALPSPTDDLTTRFARLLSRMRTEIEVALDDPDYLFAPMVRMYPRENGDDLADGRVWCAGFLLGMNNCCETWARLLNLPGVEQSLRPIYQLGECAEEIEVELAPVLQRAVQERPMSQAQCDALTDHLPQALEAVWAQLTEHQAEESVAAMQYGKAEKAWHDDVPCPCGSGKAFLSCCGSGRVLH